MVKKKGKSKRSTLKDKYKVQKRVVETGRKRRKQAKRDAKAGIVRHDKRNKDPGIPNSWPFKQNLLKEIQRTRERQQQQTAEDKEKRRRQLRALKDHQDSGGAATTVQQLLEQANRDQADFDAKSQHNEREKSEGGVAPGQASRRAFLRELKKVVDTADVLLQVLDARDPIGSRIHPPMEDAIMSRADKRMVLVLNKIDLVPKDVVGKWLTYLRRSRPTIAVKASNDRSHTQDDASTIAVPVGMDGLLQLLKNYARTGGSGGKSKTAITVGVVGYPNTGKSSIINALKRCRAVGVSPRPGFTTSMQEVVLDSNVRLLDSPGVVFDDKSAMLGNCVDADSMEDPIPAVEALLNRCNPASLIMTYNIPAFPPGDAMMFLAMVARSYGRVVKGGIPDKVAAARTVLRDWNSGKIPYFTVPPTNLTSTTSDDAVILAQFSKQFDLAQLDKEVMKGLEDKDEMDFVKLEQVTMDSTNVGELSDDLVNILTRQVDADEDMEDESSDSEDRMPRAQGIACAPSTDADDYEFGNL